MEKVLDFTPLLYKKKPRKWDWIVYWVIILFTIFFSSIVRADELKLDLKKLNLHMPCAPQITENRRAKLTYQNQPGFWFQYDVAVCMLGRLSVLPRLSERLTLFEERREVTNETIKFQKESVRLANEAREEAQDVLDSAIREKRRAIDKMNHWTRSPWLWFSIGVITTVGIMAGASILLKSIKE